MTDYDWDWAGADREFQRAFELNPNYAYAHALYAYHLYRIGQFDKAVAEGKQALEIDPLSLIANRILGQSYYYGRKNDQAIEQNRKTLELDPNFNGAHLYLGLAYVQESKYKEGLAEIEKELVISPGSPAALADLGHALAAAGRKSEAEKVLGQLDEISKHKFVPATDRAIIFTGLQDKDKALEWLEKAYEERSLGGGHIVPADPRFDPLRSNPRFKDILRRMNLKL